MQLLTVNMVLGVLSAVALVAVLLLTHVLRLREKGTYQLIFWLCVADLLSCFKRMMWDQRENAVGCFFQAILGQYPYIASFLWTCCICHTYYVAVIEGQMDWDKRYLCKYHLICWGVPLVLGVLPLTTGSYGPTEVGWCWIVNDDSNHIGTAWRFVCFYIPLWLCLTFNCVMLTKLYTGIRDALAAQGEEEGQSSKASLTQARLLLYPAVMVLCWLPPTINRVQNSIAQPVFALVMLHTVTASMHGLANALVYGFTPQVRRLLRQRCCVAGSGSNSQLSELPQQS